MKKVALGVFAVSAAALAAVAFGGEIVQPPTVSVPEPGMLGLMAVGLAAVLAVRLRRRK